MGTLPLALLLLDSSVAEIFHSPFVVPVAGCAMIACISVARIWSGVRTREIRSQERLAMIAQGLQPEPDWHDVTLRQATARDPQPGTWTAQPADGAKPRLAGLILCSVGLGLIGFFALLSLAVHTSEVLAGAAAGILPLAIGLGFLADARAKRRDYDRWLETAAPFARVPAQEATPVPPPPPVAAAPAGLTPAQASDWRPLH